MADQTTISPEALRDFYAEYGETALALKEANVRIRRLTSELAAAREALAALQVPADG